MTNRLRRRGPRPDTEGADAPEEMPPDAGVDMPEAAPPDAEPQKAGYGNPPKEYQFMPGQSGNPTGRRKGSKGLKTILKEVVLRKVWVTENGSRRKVPAIEAVLLGQLKSALAGDHRAADKMLRLIPQVSVILAEDATADATKANSRRSNTEALEEFARMIREADAMKKGGGDD